MNNLVKFSFDKEILSVYRIYTVCLYLKFTLIKIKILKFLLWIILLKIILEHSPSEFPTIDRTNEIYMNFLHWSSFLNIGWTRSLPRGPAISIYILIFSSSLMLYKYISQLMILQCWKFYLENFKICK